MHQLRASQDGRLAGHGHDLPDAEAGNGAAGGSHHFPSGIGSVGLGLCCGRTACMPLLAFDETARLRLLTICRRSSSYKALAAPADRRVGPAQSQGPSLTLADDSGLVEQGAGSHLVK